MLAIVSLWTLVKRLASARVAWMAAAILATSSQWVLVTRQAMTDMPFVAPMTAALAFAGLALHSDENEPRRKRSFGLLMGLFALIALPQLIAISIQVRASFHVGGVKVRTIGSCPCSPTSPRLPSGSGGHGRPGPRGRYICSSPMCLCALASLAKGRRAGHAGLVLLVYLVAAGRWRETRASSFCAALLSTRRRVSLVSRHAHPSWNGVLERAHRRQLCASRQGAERRPRAFDYYLQWLLYGMFPWTGLAAAARALRVFPQAAAGGVRVPGSPSS